MKVLGRIFLNSRTERRKDGVFLWVVEKLTFLIITGVVKATFLPKRDIKEVTAYFRNEDY